MTKKAQNSAPGLSVGETCYLKSGSPKLTITSIEGDVAHVFWCVYGVNEIREADVPLVALVRPNFPSEAE